MQLPRVNAVSAPRWRAGFYVAGEDGCVGNFMQLLDDFLKWKTKATDKQVEARLSS
jgi:hypothetical protein